MEEPILDQSLSSLLPRLSGDSPLLIVVGNGFDLFHGIPSSYQGFRHYLRRRKDAKDLLDVLSYLITKDDLWGDFEGSLAYLDREAMMGTLDDYLAEFNVPEDEHDDDFSAADYFTAVELAMEPAAILLNQLPRFFAQWIRSLPILADKKPLASLLKKDAFYLNFNYTETLEKVYGVSPERICYLHGNRLDKRFRPVLGHGRNEDDVFREWYEANKNRKDLQPFRRDNRGKKHLNQTSTYLAYFAKDEDHAPWSSPVQYYAVNELYERIEGYYQDSAKKTTEVLEKNEAFFSSLSSLKTILVLGHSLSDVDYPYFSKLNDVAPSADWLISFHRPEDLKRSEAMGLACHLSPQKITPFFF